MSETRAYIVLFGNGNIRWVIEWADGRHRWYDPNGELEDVDFVQEWSALWSKDSRTRDALEGEVRFRTYETQPWLGTLGVDWKTNTEKKEGTK